jgi:PIN domain nuclease of toxin-antitoxin system
MKVLLDTHILLWAAAGTLPRGAARYVEDRGNTLLFSPASLWEIAIKRALGRADFVVNAAALYDGLLGAGYGELAISAKHALLVESLPPLHKDPFDRILLAQAIGEGVPLLTADNALAGYAGPVIFAGP